MNRMARLKLSLFGLGIVLFGLSNPVLLIPCLAIGVFVFEKQVKAKKAYNHARQVRADRDYVRMFR